MKLPTTQLSLALVAATLAFAGHSSMANAQAPYTSGPAGQEAAHTDDVSQINGAPVPVGDHNRYHYDYKRWNLSINPFSPMLEYLSFAGSFAFHENIALRGEVTLGELNELGVSMPFYFRKVYSGFFIEPGLFSRNMDDDYQSVGYSMLVGWHHNWDSGLNVAYAFGLSKSADADPADDDYHYEPDTLPNGYFKVGYNF